MSNADHPDIVGRVTPATGGHRPIRATVNGTIFPTVVVDYLDMDDTISLEILAAGKTPGCLWFTPAEAINLARDLLLTVDAGKQDAALTPVEITSLISLRGIVERAIDVREARNSEVDF